MGEYFVNSDNAKRPEGVYKSVIEQIKKDGVCPFCPGHFAAYHQKPIVAEGTYWILTDNMYPYEGSKYQLLLVHKVHIETISEMTSEAWVELLELVQREVKRREIAGGTFYARFGDTKATGASVTHLHANVIVPKSTDKDREPLMIRAG